MRNGRSAVMPLPSVQMLWIEGALTTLERLSIASFLANGHAVHLYSYGLKGDAPAGTIIMDAAEILDRSGCFEMPANVGHGSITPFSNHFRYKLLHERGGIWCDSDVVLLKPLAFLDSEDYWFCSEYTIPEGERQSPAIRVASCFIKAPKGCAAMKECFERAVAVDATRSEWGASGPQLLGEVVARHRLDRGVMKPNAICPLPYWDIAKLLSGMHTLPADSYAIHCYNEMFRRNFFDKDATYPAFSIYERLKAHYLDTAR